MNLKLVKKYKKLRMPITNELFNHLLNHPKPKNWRLMGHYRFRLCCVLLYATGLRLSDVATLTYQDIINLMQNGVTQIIVHKTGRPLVVMVSSKNQYSLLSLKNEMDIIFKDLLVKNMDKKEKVYLLNLCHTKTLSLFNYWFNNHLSHYLQEISYRLKDTNLFHQLALYRSHSFRIGRVTRLLSAKVPIQEVAILMGHKNIQTTALYNRFSILNKNHHQRISHIEDQIIL